MIHKPVVSERQWDEVTLQLLRRFNLLVSPVIEVIHRPGKVMADSEVLFSDARVNPRSLTKLSADASPWENYHVIRESLVERGFFL